MGYRKRNKDPPLTTRKRSKRCSPRNTRHGKDASPPVELNFENDNSSSSVTRALTTQTSRGSTTTSMNNRAIVVFDSTVVKESKDKDTFEDIVLKLEKDDVEGGDGGDSDEEGIEANDHEEGMYREIMEREEEGDNNV